VNNPQKAIQFLENQYRWSSYWDYLGKPNFPSLTSRDFFMELFGGQEEIKKEIDSWILFKTLNASNKQFNEQPDKQLDKRPELMNFLE
jgi:hypothetical protein